MRYLAALPLCLLLASAQTHACLGPSLENTLFFKAIPIPQPDATVIATVSLSNIKDGMATAKIIKLIKASDSKVQLGKKFTIKYNFTSCGPNHVNGESGMVIANVRTDSKGNLVLYPYMQRYEDGRITPPSMNK